MFTLTELLTAEWKPALGCTEPASIAYATASASGQASGHIERIELICDPRIYKNCYAVGIPRSDHRIGIAWALAIGSQISDSSSGLECFQQIDESILSKAQNIIDNGLVHVQVDPKKQDLFIDCRIYKTDGIGRAIVAGEHDRLVLVDSKIDTDWTEPKSHKPKQSIRQICAELSFEKLMELSRSLSLADQLQIEAGLKLNLAIAHHGLSLFPQRFIDLSQKDSLARISCQVCAGVYARMWGEDFVVMSLSGSGNKGITCSVPLAMRGHELGCEQKTIAQALALAFLVTSATTYHLGSLSAVCGCSNAAGIGLAAGLVMLEGGGVEEMSMAVNNMVGNITGMICDGAKIGCALKSMTSVDAAFRSASLAMSGIGIPVSDGIVGVDGKASLKNLARIATRGMVSTDIEILEIMQEKFGLVR